MQYVVILHFLPVLLQSGALAATHHKYRQWYPYFHDIFKRELQGSNLKDLPAYGNYTYNDCKENYTAYQEAVDDWSANQRCYDG